MVALHHILAAGCTLPEHLHWQMDGGSENWNKCVFGFCAYLVSVGVFKTIVLSRLPVGHTHEDIDAWFGRLSRHFWGFSRGSSLRASGNDALDPPAFEAGVLAASNANISAEWRKARTAWVWTVFDCTAWLDPYITNMAGYGPSDLHMRTAQGEVVMSGKRSHTLYAKFSMPAGEQLARVSFAANILEAEKGSYQAENVAALTSMPVGEPLRCRYTAQQWQKDGRSLWEKCLAGLRAASSTLPTLFTPAVVARWVQFGRDSKCDVPDWAAVMEELRPALGAAPVAPPSPLAPVLFSAVPLVCPITHAGYTAAQQARDLNTALLGESQPPLEVDFKSLEVNDWVLAIAPNCARCPEFEDSHFSFAGSGRVGRLCELLWVKAFRSGRPSRQVLYEYYKLVDSQNGKYTFEPLGREIWQPWQAREGVLLWKLESEDAPYSDGDAYTVPAEQAAQARRVLQVAEWLPIPPDAAGPSSDPAARGRPNSTTAAAAAGPAAAPAHALARVKKRGRAPAGDGAPGAAGRGGKGSRRRRSGPGA